MSEFWHAIAGVDFMPHGHCYLWQPELVALHSGSDAVIALSYFTIPLTMAWVARQRRDLPFRGVFIAFVLFILACGTGHMVEVVTLWEPYYWVSGSVKGATALLSVATAGLLVRIAPRAVAAPSPRDLAVAHARTAMFERRFRAAADGSLDAFLLLLRHDGVLRVEYANPPAERLLADMTTAFPAGMRVADQVDLTSLIAEAERVGVAVVGDFEFTQAGSPVQWRVQVVPLEEGLSVTIRDVTDSSRADQLQLRLAAIVNSSEDAIFILDEAGVIGSWNPGAASLFGRSEEQALGVDYIAEFCPPDRRDDARTALRAAFDGASHPPVETVRLRGDGEPVPVSVRKSQIRGSRGGVFGVACIVRDLTDSRQAAELRDALAEREVLIQEIHHRVKNDLQLTASLMRMQARRAVHDEAKASLGEAIDRINAVALVHEQLYQAERLGRIRLDEFLRQLVDRAGAVTAERTRLDWHLSAIEVDVHVAIPCGLILYELITNAYKHAFADGAGQVSVRLTDGQPRVLSVQDDGAPLPEGFSAESGGMGMRLLRALADQLGGSLHVHPLEQGKRFEVRF